MSGAFPQYQQVADTLRRRICDGEYRIGEALPTAIELERSFSVSNITIRKAVDILAGEGLVAGRRGVGTIVTAPPEPAEIEVKLSGNFAEWLDTASGEDQDIEQEVLDIAVASAPLSVVRLLGLQPEDSLWSMRRVRRIDGEPISLHINYGREKDFGFITPKTMGGSRSFVDVMRKECSFALRRVDQRVAATTADRDLTDTLGIPFGAPAFSVENIYTASDGIVVAVSHLYLRADRYAYQACIEL